MLSIENYNKYSNCINILFKFKCTLSVLLISILFGQKGLVGYMSGLNLVAIHMIYLNTIKMQMAKNIKIYNEGNKLIYN